MSFFSISKETVMKKTNYPNNLYAEAGIKYIDVPKNAKDIMESMFIDSDITDKERDCLLRYYRDGQTLEEIGNDYDLTRECIRLILIDAKLKLLRNAWNIMVQTMKQTKIIIQTEDVDTKGTTE